MSADTYQLKDLVEEVGPMCALAVDELDIAVALESDGLNDAVASERYGVSGVHDLATKLLSEVPTTVHESDTSVDDVRIPYVRLAGRGLLYAIPGLFYLVLARSIHSRAAVLCLIVAMAGGWALSQAIAVVAYRMLARTGPRNVTQMLRRCLMAAVPLAGLVFSVAICISSAAAAAAVMAQLLYVIAATVLLFHDADRILILVLIPGSMVSLLFLVDTGIQLPESFALDFLALTVIAALVAAALVEGPTADIGAAPTAAASLTAAFQPPLRSEIMMSGPFALCGLLCALAVVYRPLWIVFGQSHGAVGSTLDITMLPLVLSMGYAEIELRWLRRSGLRLSLRSHSLDDFGRGVLRLLVVTELRLALALFLLSCAVGIGMWYDGGFTADSVTRMGAYLALGCAFLASLMMSAVDQVGAALRGFAVAAVLIVLFACQVLVSGWSLTPDQAYLAACLITLGCIWVAAFRVLRNPVHLA